MRRSQASLIAIALTAVVLSGCSSPAPAAAPPIVSESATTPPPRQTAPADIPRSAATLAPPTQGDPPVGVAISAIGIDVPVIPVGVESDGFMELPPDPAIAGWYRYGPDPSTGQGNTVIAAHIDSPDYPIGPFASLRDVPAGSEVVVATTGGGMLRYAVESITYYPKAELPTAALFERTGPPALVLITCGGEFDSSTGHYRDNVVMIAKPVA
ncbi:class F sortase [Microbacterium rhizomatis]|uniref:Class F sortase n=1 Tax=Microbacterium rhizomatis TaxID=1631477 RepID=A0A5J5J6I3_9MICO|nr:class F sortase [Microbacterium rhizomatis]KAA9110393.1 class F sortase [Microbacterium rhizomatis]